MVTQLPSSTSKGIIYPESDEQPMADNTKQFGISKLNGEQFLFTS